MQDAECGSAPPYLQELRPAIDQAPVLVGHVVQLDHSHRTALEKRMQLGSERMPDGLLASSPETIIHDFFRDHANYFAELEAAAEKLREAEPCEVDDVYAVLKARLYRVHGIEVRTAPVEEIGRASCRERVCQYV